MHTPLGELKRLLDENNFRDEDDFCARVHSKLEQLSAEDMQRLTLAEKNLVCDSQSYMSPYLINVLTEKDRTFRWMLTTNAHSLFSAFIQALSAQQYDNAEEMSEFLSDEEGEDFTLFLEKNPIAARFTGNFLKELASTHKKLAEFISKKHTIFSEFVIDMLGDLTKDCDPKVLKVFSRSDENRLKLCEFVRHDEAKRVMKNWQHRMCAGHVNMIKLFLTIGNLDPDILLPEALDEARKENTVSLLVKSCVYILDSMSAEILQLRQEMNIRKPHEENILRCKLVARYQLGILRFMPRVKILIESLTEEEKVAVGETELQILREVDEVNSVAQQLRRSQQQDGFLLAKEAPSPCPSPHCMKPQLGEGTH